MRAKEILLNTLVLVAEEVTKHQHGEGNDHVVIGNIRAEVAKLSDFADIEIGITVNVNEAE
jgi:hypothetical protein